MRPLVLVACCAEKAPAARPAQDLYLSDLFKKARAWAETFGHAWWILSAENGIVHPFSLTEPYDTRLGDLTTEQLDLWEATVAAHCGIIVRSYPGRPVVILAGRAYRNWAHGRGYFTPLAGMAIGQQKQWLKRCVDEGAADIETSLTLHARKDPK